MSGEPLLEPLDVAVARGRQLELVGDAPDQLRARRRASDDPDRYDDSGCPVVGAELVLAPHSARPIFTAGMPTRAIAWVRQLKRLAAEVIR